MQILIDRYEKMCRSLFFSLFPRLILSVIFLYLATRFFSSISIALYDHVYKSCQKTAASIAQDVFTKTRFTTLYKRSIRIYIAYCYTDTQERTDRFDRSISGKIQCTVHASYNKELL